MYIFLAILAFSVLIASHEFGHFIIAKACGVKVNEFSVGMGPAILKKQGKETLYSLRILPIGGFCAMEGEDEDTGDERAFTRQPVWKRALILAAGAAMNFVTGLIVIILIYANFPGFATNELAAVSKGFKYGENGLEAGDRIWKIDGHRIYYSSDFATYMQRSRDGTVDMVVIRNGEKVTLRDYGIKPEMYPDGNGGESLKYGLYFRYKEATAIDRLKYSCYTSYNFVRMVWMGLSDLVTGNAGIKDMSGVVGIVDTINTVGEESETREDALINIAYLCAFIAINLAVMNMLPIPALDGGRLFFMVITFALEKVLRRKIDPKYEGYVHAAGLVLLLGLMGFVMINDVIRIVG